MLLCVEVSVGIGNNMGIGGLDDPYCLVHTNQIRDFHYSTAIGTTLSLVGRIDV
ncbi:MAG: hypothetical protein JXA82_03965 [Sedimentisphaerales bacterium]|nr:hypothetical protein [Sedimentisphaerales bacterium]